MDKVNVELAKKLRHQLHAHPELSNEEVWTKAHLIKFLKEHTKLEIVEKERWFYAIYHSPVGKRNIAFRADFDAIPMEEGIDLPHGSKYSGVSHKCGHDGHSAALAVFAMEIEKRGCDNNIFFLFQHAEETGDGAAECVELMKEQRIDEIFAYHNMSGYKFNSVYVIEGSSNCASKGMSIYFEGKPSHASEPEKGINPAFAIAEIISSIDGFLDPTKNKGMVLCTVVHVEVGEKAFGVNASKGVLRMTIRALYEEELLKLQKNLEDLALKLAKEQGLSVTFEYQDGFPDTSNHPESVDKIKAVCKEKNISVYDMPEPFRGSEDFGHYLKLTKGAIFYVGNGEDYPHLHSYKYDFNDDIFETAIEVFLGLANS